MKRKIIVLDHLPTNFKVRKQIKTNHDNVIKPSPRISFLVNDKSGALLVDHWKSAWKYCMYHVRVIQSNNRSFPEYTTFINSKVAALMIGANGYFSIHKAIVNNVPINNCYFEYTTTKETKFNHYKRGDKTFS